MPARKKEANRSNLTINQRAALALLGQALTFAPGQIKKLLENYRVRLTELPTSTELRDQILELMKSGNPLFIQDLSKLLADFHVRMEQQREASFDPTMIAAALGPISTGIGSIFSSKNDRMAVEAETKAQVASSQIQAKQSFWNSMAAIKSQAQQSKLSAALSKQKSNITMAVIGASLIALLAYFGHRYRIGSLQIPNLKNPLKRGK